MKFKNITYHKGDKWSILSFVGSLNGGHQKKRYFSQDSRWRRPCQDISQIWPRIRCIHEHMRCHLVIQKELCQNLWQLEVSETRVAFVSSTPSSDLSHRRNSMSVYLTSYHHLFMAHSIKGLMHKSPRGLALSQVALYFILNLLINAEITPIFYTQGLVEGLLYLTQTTSFHKGENESQISRNHIFQVICQLDPIG